MAAHERFRFRDPDELRETAHRLGVEIPWSDDTAILFEPITIGKHRVTNRLAVMPMEGADGDEEGSPTDLTFRRYGRYASGGSGLIWFEATAVVPEGRSTPNQLVMGKEHLDSFRWLTDHARSKAGCDLLLILQLTHAGRYSRPVPVLFQHDAVLDSTCAVENNTPLIPDAELDQLHECYILAAVRAARAGFDGVDIKACHGYLVNEILAGHNRHHSRYGGMIENRAHFLLKTVAHIRHEVPELLVTCRLSAADFVPGGFGMGLFRRQQEDLAEPKTVAARLRELGTSLLGISIGNSRVAPHVVRPFDSPVPGAAYPPEHPLEGVARHLRITSELQRTFPDLPMAGAGYSWLRHFFPHVAAGAIKKGWVSLAGMGRLALAYPDAPRHLAEKGKLLPQRACTTCSGCSQLLQADGPVGCISFDSEIYRIKHEVKNGNKSNE